MQFSVIGKAVAKQFQAMTATGLFRVNIDKDSLWDTYLASFPEGSNPIYKERTEHDCNCCKGFIRNLGGVVSIANGKILTIWDINVGGHYQVVADKMAELVRTAVEVSGINNIYLHNEATVGVANTRQLLEDQTVMNWEHFFVNLPTGAVSRGAEIGTRTGEVRATYDVMRRSLTEITMDSIDTVLELIDQNSLYRGEEHKFAVTEFRKLKVKHDKLKTAMERELLCWSQLYSQVPIAVARIRNTVIGTLLTDLSEGKYMEDAVKQFETKVAPTNYKRPTALVTKAMIQKAQQKIEELGFTTALDRRYATIEDITVNNILFANRESKKKMNVFDELSAQVPEKTKNFDKVEEVKIEDFLTKILPKAESVEVMFENRHAGNLVSLIAPVDPTAKTMFKWPNNFSWSYAGELADSIKERVKKAGGKVDGDFRASLSWHNYDDLDLHMMEPGGNRIYFGSKYSHRTYGQLDVDMNAGRGQSRSPVENITYPDRKRMEEGTYKLYVHNFARRESIDVGFEVEIEFDGVIHTFAYDKAVRDKDNILVAEFKFSRTKGIEFVQSLPSSQASKTLWNLPTQNFHKVNVLMLSPNHWDEKAVGNKHYFFMLDGCLNEDKARGFFNEFLTEELNQHRKVFEMVGSKMKTEESDRQLSGLGFSSTQRNSVLCRVKGSFSRVIKINF